MAKLILASGNKGKLREFSEMMAPLGWDVEAQGAYSVPDIEETGLTFVENAILKARNCCKHTGFAALARTTPQLNIFMVAFMVNILAGLYVLSAALPSLVALFHRIIYDSFELIGELLNKLAT